MPSRPELARLRKGRPYRTARAQAIARDNGICWICGRPGATSADHIVPISAGGDPTSLLNLRAAHISCNSKRGANRPTSSTIETSRTW